MKTMIRLNLNQTGIKIMSAYVVVSFTPINEDKMKEYGAAVPSILAKYSGEYLAKGPVKNLNGHDEFKMMVIITFPTREKADEWFYSDEYSAISEVRNEAMNSRFQLIG